MAYTFKDIRGTEITGTNTMFEKMHIEHSEAGDVCTVTFTQDMFLQGGEYLLSFDVPAIRMETLRYSTDYMMHVILR